MFLVTHNHIFVPVCFLINILIMANSFEYLIWVRPTVRYFPSELLCDVLLFSPFSRGERGAVEKFCALLGVPRPVSSGSRIWSQVVSLQSLWLSVLWLVAPLLLPPAHQTPSHTHFLFLICRFLFCLQLSTLEILGVLSLLYFPSPLEVICEQSYPHWRLYLWIPPEPSSNPISRFALPTTYV